MEECYRAEETHIGLSLHLTVYFSTLYRSLTLLQHSLKLIFRRLLIGAMPSTFLKENKYIRTVIVLEDECNLLDKHNYDLYYYKTTVLNFRYREPFI